MEEIRKSVADYILEAIHQLKNAGEQINVYSIQEQLRNKARFHCTDKEVVEALMTGKMKD